MDILSMVTAGVSIGTFVMIIVKFIWDSKQKKIDRNINIRVIENRRKQEELLKNITGIIEVYNQLEDGKLLKENNILYHEILSYKMGVKINLNYENKFKDSLKRNCDDLVIWVVSALKYGDVEQHNRCIKYAKDNQHEILQSIEDYIEDENRIVRLMLSGGRRY